MSKDNIFERELYGSSVFKDETTLIRDYVPPKLPRREQELLRLARDFKPLLYKEKGSFSVNVAIIGPPGVGKTASAKFFIKKFPPAAAKAGVNVKFAYYNCYTFRSKSGILRNLLESEFNRFTTRGFSDDELLRDLNLTLEKRNEHLILVLDEAMMLGANDLLEFLHSPEAFKFGKSRMSFILISRINEFRSMAELQESERINDIIELSGYSKDELHEILKYRISLAFYEEVVSPEVLDLVIEIASATQNARHGIEILHQAGKIADNERKRQIEPEMIRKAKGFVYPELRADVLEELKYHELLTALAISRILKDENKAITTIDEVFSTYSIVCEEKGVKPRAKITYRRQVDVLKDVGIINKFVSAKGSGQKGRFTRITLHYVPSAVLEEKIEKILEKKVVFE
ncbi:MAG: Cdc6/Cdc18 family protein [Candidatus Helarchaeales archaeon]